MDLKPGSRWKSAVCDAEVVIVRAPKAPCELQCGGKSMLPMTAPKQQVAIDPAFAGGVLMGKRYTDEQSTIEVLCSKAGAGSLSVDGAPLAPKDSKKLPSSD